VLRSTLEKQQKPDHSIDADRNDSYRSTQKSGVPCFGFSKTLFQGVRIQRNHLLFVKTLTCGEETLKKL